MSPNPEPPPEKSSLPPRQRPILGDLSQDTTETELWALDDLDDDAAPAIQPPRDPARIANRDIPAARERKPSVKPTSPEPHSSNPIPPAHTEERIRMNVGKSSNKTKRQGDIVTPAKQASDFDDLEQWDIEETPREAVTHEQAQPEGQKTVPLQPAASSTQAPDSTPETISNPPPQQVTESPETDDEYSPVAKPGAVPISLRPHLSLSKIERIGIITLLVLLIVAGGSIYFLSINRLPTETIKAQTNDFPIKGEKIVIQSAESYWRPPITEGPDRDIFRRDSQLLPVVEFSIKGGPAAIKVVFRDENQQIIGDAITRAVQSDGIVKIAGTAGFDDMGMYAAYRTGGNKPWTIEVLEADSAESDSTEFNKVFEMDISTALR